MPPKVSVVIPVYNVAPFLRECLDSVLNQSLRDIEVICGDGGSTDGSLEILREYARRDSRIQIIHKQGSGYGQSVNDCMHMARGEYIGIVESDDAIKPQMYEVLYQVAKKKELDWVRGDIYFYSKDKSGRPRLRYEKIIIGNFYNSVLDPKTDPRPYRCRLRTWSGIYRKSFLERYEIMHNETPGASYQDVGFYLKSLFYARRVSFLPHAFYLWRQDNFDSSTHLSSVYMVKHSVREWTLNWNYVKEHPDLGEQALYGFRYRQFLSYMWALNRAIGTEKMHFQDTARHLFTEIYQNGEFQRCFFTSREWRLLERFIHTGESRDLRQRIHQWFQEVVMH